MTKEKELNSTEEETTVEETPEIEEESTQESVSEPEESKQDRNWRELREQTEALKKERDEYLGLLKRIQEEAMRQQVQTKPKEVEDDFDYSAIDDDDLPDGKIFKKALQYEQKKRKELEDYIRSQRQESYESQVKNELQSKFGDFDQVVNMDNIVKLREARPGLARSLHMNPDLKEKAIETYYAIKDLGLYQPQSYSQDRERVKKNISKPRTAESLGGKESSDPLSYANAFSDGLTEDLKKKLYEQARKKAGRV